jgi:hypothetical protein
MGILRSICMYCGKQYGEKDSQGAPSGDSHGICAECAKKSQEELDAIADARAAARPRKSFSDFLK